MIYYLHTRPESKNPGWCYASKESLAEEVGLTKRGLLKMFDRLIELGFLERDENTRFLRTTKLWFSVYFASEQSSPGVNKVHRRGEQSSPLGSEQSSLHNNNLIIINDNNKQKEIFLPFNSEKFFQKWQEWQKYRKERRLPSYKPIGLKKFFDELKELAGGDEQTAVSILEQSMRKNWQGIFPLKNNQHDGQSKTRTGQIGRTFTSDRL